MPTNNPAPITTNDTPIIQEEDDYITVNGHRIYLPGPLRAQILQEHRSSPHRSAITQFSSATSLGGFVCAVGLPDFHQGYALPIGSVAVIDPASPEAAISPDGVGFDINCGVRFLKTNLALSQLGQDRDRLADRLVDLLPFGDLPQQARSSLAEINAILDRGMEYLAEVGRVTGQDQDRTESRGCVAGASKSVPQQAKARGQAQLGTLGSGNHYLEVEVVEEICDQGVADTLGLWTGQIVISIHTGSRGVGHGCCSSIVKEIHAEAHKEVYKERFRTVAGELSRAEKRREYARIRQETSEATGKAGELTQVPLASPLGRKYVALMNSASNFAWANRSVIAEKTRGAFAALFPWVEVETVYDASHNGARVEQVGTEVLVLRKGASRILPPGHGDLPVEYRATGQPVLVGGSMGTCSYLVVGAAGAQATYFSTCHGAGRQVGRQAARKEFSVAAVLKDMKNKDIVFRIGSEGGVAEECPACYKDVGAVVAHAEKVGISRAVCRVRPVIVIKG